MKRTVLALIALTLINATSTYAGPVTGGLVEWLDANTGVTADGSGRVSGWADQSGSGHDASQLDPNLQPLLVNNALNGNAVLRFDASNSLAIFGQVLTSQQFTIMAVVNDVTTSSSSNTGFREVFSNWTPSNNISSVFLGTTNADPVNARFTDEMGGATDPLHTQTGVGTITNPATHFIFTGVSDSTNAAIYQGSNAIATNGQPLSPRDLTTAYSIGTQGGFEFWNGDIAEILVYDRALNSSELQANWDYLDQKFGTSSVPEPSSFALLGLGGIGLAIHGYRRRRVGMAV